MARPTGPSKPWRAAAPARASPASGGAPDPPEESDDGAIRVLCVDDHAVLVEGLKAQFAIDGRIRVVGQLGSAERLAEEVARLRPDVVLMDIEMPGPDAFETADRVLRAHPGLRLVFLSAHVRDGYLASAHASGAVGYFSKADDPQAIAEGIRAIARAARGRTEFVMGPKVRERCRPLPRAGARTGRAGVGDAPATPLGSLSERELEVLRLIGRGRSRREIAGELSRSAKTIDGHQERMMKKLGIATRAELMRFAIREGLAEA